MLDATDSPYPGEGATVDDLLALAASYAKAARHLSLLVKKGEPATRAPGHLCAVHAVELYLSSYLRHCGVAACELRGLQHDVAARMECAARHGLVVDPRTAAHLERLVSEREYLVSRYGPDQLATLSQRNRVEATLREVQSKVLAAIRDTPGREAKIRPVVEAEPSDVVKRGRQSVGPTRAEEAGFNGVVLGPGGELFELKMTPVRR